MRQGGVPASNITYKQAVLSFRPARRLQGERGLLQRLKLFELFALPPLFHPRRVRPCAIGETEAVPVSCPVEPLKPATCPSRYFGVQVALVNPHLIGEGFDLATVRPFFEELHCILSDPGPGAISPG
jgi:hypothetical protein